MHIIHIYLYIYIYFVCIVYVYTNFAYIIHILVWWVECSPMVHQTRIQSQVKSYKRPQKMVLDAFLFNKSKVDQFR